MGGGLEYPPKQWSSVKPERDKHLQGIIDMGSNGIRFSVSSLKPPTARILPTLISYRVDISLYSAQYANHGKGEKIPISDHVIRKVIAAFLRFKIICADLNVPEDGIRIVATEATRTAINSLQFRNEIKVATGLVVDMLGKEEEGYVGALGVASGFSDVSGIIMDLGGGSCQITWMISHAGQVQVSPLGSRSFPYGAAALTRKLAELRRDRSKENGDFEVAKFREEMHLNFLNAYKELEIPDEIVRQAKAEGGFRLYLSGGGFRGWGYIILYLSQRKRHHYPISIINGFTVGREQFQDTETMKNVAKTAHKIFRVSDRRREQVPAVAFLVSAVSSALPHGIKSAHFAQGGVREGVLFRELSPEVRSQDPLEIATRKFSKESAPCIARLLLASIPAPGQRRTPESITTSIIQAFANVLYVHSPMSKESASTAALYSTSTGLMSDTHGVSHENRALLALMLERRYEGELPPREADFKFALQQILTPEDCWWANYLGAIGLLISKAYPAGMIDVKQPRFKISSAWASDLGKMQSKEGIRMTLHIKKTENDPMMMKETLANYSNDVVKVGKKRNWIGGKKGWGMKIVTQILEVDVR